MWQEEIIDHGTYFTPHDKVWLLYLQINERLFIHQTKCIEYLAHIRDEEARETLASSNGPKSDNDTNWQILHDHTNNYEKTMKMPNIKMGITRVVWKM